jgi:hypothetical protein
MADWVTISSLATAGGTLVLAVATFGSTKSANRSARVAERALLAGMRPILVPSTDDDPVERVGFAEDHWVMVAGHGAAAEFWNGNVYMAIGLRNGGAGLAILHGWRVDVRDGPAPQVPPELGEFTVQNRDLYIPAGGSGYWQGALRDHGDPMYDRLVNGVSDGSTLIVDLLYGDYEGGQRTIARFAVRPPENGARRADVVRYWNVDGEDPRSRDAL